jgi:hypothetical protein
MAYFNLLNLDPSVYQNESGLDASYPGTGTLSPFFKTADGGVWSAHGDRYLATAADISAWGLQPSNWITLSDTNANKAHPNRELGTLVITDSGGVYSGSGGQRHHVQSYATYIQLSGGNPSKAVKVSDEFLNVSPVGADLP